MIKNADRTSASSQLRRIFCSLFVVAAAVSLVAAVASSNAVGQRIGGDAVNIANKVAPWVVEHTAYGQQAEFFVVIAERADLTPAANLPTKTEKRPLRLSNSAGKGPDYPRTNPAMAARTQDRASIFLYRQCYPGERHSTGRRYAGGPARRGAR